MDTNELTLEQARERINELEKQLADMPTQDGVCPRCGRPSSAGPVQLSEEVKRAYFRSLLGQTQFSHTFLAYGGMYKITFTTLSGEALATQRANNKLLKKEDISFDDYLAELNTATMMGTLTKVETFDPDSQVTHAIYEATAEDRVKYAANAEEAYNTLLSKLDQLQLTLIRRANDAFVMLCTLLTELGDDQDFYEGAGLL